MKYHERNYGKECFRFGDRQPNHKETKKSVEESWIILWNWQAPNISNMKKRLVVKRKTDNSTNNETENQNKSCKSNYGQEHHCWLQANNQTTMQQRSQWKNRESNYGNCIKRRKERRYTPEINKWGKRKADERTTTRPRTETKSRNSNHGQHGKPLAQMRQTEVRSEPRLANQLTGHQIAVTTYADKPKTTTLKRERWSIRNDITTRLFLHHRTTKQQGNEEVSGRIVNQIMEMRNNTFATRKYQRRYRKHERKKPRKRLSGKLDQGTTKTKRLSGKPSVREQKDTRPSINTQTECHTWNYGEQQRCKLPTAAGHWATTITQNEQQMPTLHKPQHT